MNGYKNDILNFVDFLISNLIDRKDYEMTSADEDEYGLIKVEVLVDKSVMGAIIGRAGDTIQSIRKIVSTMASKYTKRVWINVRARTGDNMAGKVDLASKNKNIDISSMHDLDLKD